MFCVICKLSSFFRVGVVASTKQRERERGAVAASGYVRDDVNFGGWNWTAAAVYV